METDGNATDASPVFLLDYFHDSYGYGQTTTDTEGSFQGPGSEIGSRSLGLGIPDTLIARRIVHYCFGTMLALSGVAGTLGNVLVLYVFTRYRRLRGGGGPLILSLASGDLMVSVWHFMPAYSSFTENWSFGDLASVGLGGMASLITLSVIAADRFSVIMGRPLPWLSGKKKPPHSCKKKMTSLHKCLVGMGKYGEDMNKTSRRADLVAFDLITRKGYIIDPTIRMETNNIHQPESVNLEKKKIYDPCIPSYYEAKFNLREMETIGPYIGFKVHGGSPIYSVFFFVSLRSYKTCCCIWLFCHILVIPPFLGWSKYQQEGLGTSCSWDYTTRTWNNRSYYIFILFFGFVVPVTVIIVSYVGILRVVCQHSNKMNGVTRNGIIHNKKRPTKNDLRTAQVILKIVVCFLISWTPYALVSLIGQFGDASSLTPLGTALPAMFAKASVIYNPIVYSLSHPHFRSAIHTLKAHYFSKGHPSGPHHRYHYHLAGYAGRRRHFHDGKVRFKDETQNKKRYRRSEPSGTNSETGTTNFGQGMSMRTCSSRGSGTDVVINRKGWAIIRRYSPDIESDVLTGHTCTAGLDGYCEMSGIESAAQSEPEWIADDMVLKLPECISMDGGSAEKKQLIQTSFFRSENCLENLLKIEKPECVRFIPEEYEKRSATTSDAKKRRPQECAMECKTSLDSSVIGDDIKSTGYTASQNILHGAKFFPQTFVALNDEVVAEKVGSTTSGSSSDNLKQSLSTGNFISSSSHRSAYSSPRQCSPRGIHTGGHHAYDRNDVVQLKRFKCVTKIREAPKVNKYSLANSPMIRFRDRPYLLNESFLCQDDAGGLSSFLKTKCLCNFCNVDGYSSSVISKQVPGGLDKSLQADLWTNSDDGFRRTNVGFSLKMCDWRESTSNTDTYQMQDTVDQENCKQQGCSYQSWTDRKASNLRALSRKNLSLDSYTLTSCSEEDSELVYFNEQDDEDQQSLYESVMTSPSNLSDLSAAVNCGSYDRSSEMSLKICMEPLLEAVHIYKNPWACGESSYDSDTFYSCG